MKIRQKLTFLFAVIVAVFLISFCLVIFYLSYRYRKDEFYERLREKATTTARIWAEIDQKTSTETLRLIEEQDSVVLFSERVTVLDDHFYLLYDSQEKDLKFNSQTLSKLKEQKEWGVSLNKIEYQIQDGEREILYKFIQDSRRKLIVVVSAIDTYGRSKMLFLTRIMIFGCLFGIFIIIVAGWIFADTVVEPIIEVIRQVEVIELDTLHKQRVIAGNEKDEIAQLAETFNRMLERLQNALFIQNSFVSNASHELRTPLTVMAGHLEVALLQKRSTDEYQEILLSLQEDVSNMTALANELLDLAQVSSDASDIPFTETRVDEMILEAKSDLLKKKSQYNINIDFVDPPDEESYFSMFANNRLLKNAFINLLENGCKFSANRGVFVKLHFKEKNIELLFQDQGIGIAQEDLPYIFEPFYRSKNAKGVPGYGIGLPLTKKIIELHHGSINAYSVLNEGSTFKVVLPHRVEIKDRLYMNV
jgi:signal transduction histidine kinase